MCEYVCLLYKKHMHIFYCIKYLFSVVQKIVLSLKRLSLEDVGHLFPLSFLFFSQLSTVSKSYCETTPTNKRLPSISSGQEDANFLPSRARRRHAQSSDHVVVPQ